MRTGRFIYKLYILIILLAVVILEGCLFTMLILCHLCSSELLRLLSFFKKVGNNDYLSKIMLMFASRLVVTQRIRYENRIKRLLQERLSLSISL